MWSKICGPLLAYDLEGMWPVVRRAAKMLLEIKGREVLKDLILNVRQLELSYVPFKGWIIDSDVHSLPCVSPHTLVPSVLSIILSSITFSYRPDGAMAWRKLVCDNKLFLLIAIQGVKTIILDTRVRNLHLQETLWFSFTVYVLDIFVSFPKREPDSGYLNLFSFDT